MHRVWWWSIRWLRCNTSLWGSCRLTYIRTYSKVHAWLTNVTQDIHTAASVLWNTPQTYFCRVITDGIVGTSHKLNLFSCCHIWLIHHLILLKELLNSYISFYVLWKSFLFKGPYANHILIPQGSTGSSTVLISNESPYFSICRSKISASNSL